MKTLKKSIAGVVTISVLGLTYPHFACCAGTRLFVKADQPAITQHAPKILSTPAENIPLVEAAPEEKKGISKWVWIGLGVLAVGGIAAAAGGGGGGGGGGSDDADVSLSW